MVLSYLNFKVLKRHIIFCLSWIVGVQIASLAACWFLVGLIFRSNIKQTSVKWKLLPFVSQTPLMQVFSPSNIRAPTFELWHHLEYFSRTSQVYPQVVGAWHVGASHRIQLNWKPMSLQVVPWMAGPHQETFPKSHPVPDWFEYVMHALLNSFPRPIECFEGEIISI